MTNLSVVRIDAGLEMVADKEYETTPLFDLIRTCSDVAMGNAESTFVSLMENNLKRTYTVTPPKVRFLTQ
jgi:hypothetical protein